MVEILRITSIVLLIFQVVLFIKYNKDFAVIWLSGESISKAGWINKRDRFLLILSLLFICFSIFFINSFYEVTTVFNYAYSILILAMTIIIKLYYNTKFKIFQPIKLKKSKSKILLNEKFIIQKITEKELKALVEKKYSDSFISKLEDFRHVFLEGNTNGIKLICTHKVHRSKNVGYIKIFNLMQDLSENGILDLMDEERKKFLTFVIKNFKRGEENIVKSNLNPAYSKWLNNNR